MRLKLHSSSLIRFQIVSEAPRGIVATVRSMKCQSLRGVEARFMENPRLITAWYLEGGDLIHLGAKKRGRFGGLSLSCRWERTERALSVLATRHP